MARNDLMPMLILGGGLFLAYKSGWLSRLGIGQGIAGAQGVAGVTWQMASGGPGDNPAAKGSALGSALSSSGVTAGGQHPNGLYYLLVSASGNPARLTYRVGGGRTVSVTVANYADSIVRTATIKAGGQVETVQFGAGQASLALTVAQPPGETQNVEISIQGAPNPYVGWDRISVS